MSESPAAIGAERVFIRHAKDKFRGDIYRLSDAVKAPFPTSSGSSCASAVNVRASGRWLLGVQTADHAWIALFSNAASGPEIFKTLAASRNLDAVCVGYDPKRGWTFQLNRAGKRAADFSLPPQHADQVHQAHFKSTELDAALLEGCRSGDEALQRLCQAVQVDLDACRVEQMEGEFRVLSVQGKLLGGAVRGHFIKNGYALNAGELPASDALEKAIKRCDPEAIRKAVADGARLDVLPDTSVSPLLSALFKCQEPRGKDCVALLVELGCPVDGFPGDDPTVLNCVEHFLDESLSLEMLRTIVPLGANLNAVDRRSGTTALHKAVVYPRALLVDFLLTHGADPTIKDHSDQTPLDWLTERLKQGYDRDRREYAPILALLTGKPPETPAAQPPPGLTIEQSAAVRRQIAQCLGIEPASVVPGASFFADLGGTADHLKPLRLGIEQALGVSLEPIVAAVNTRTEIDPRGNVSYDSLSQIQAYLPAWSVALRPCPFPSLFTVSMIEAMAAKALEEKQADAAKRPATLSPEHSAAVRASIARFAKVPVERLSAETNLVGDLKMTDRSLGLLLAMLNLEMDKGILEALDDVQRELQLDPEGRLTDSSRTRLARLLPGVQLPDGPGRSLDDLFTVEMIESVVGGVLASRPADLPLEDIRSAKQQAWVHQLPEELGERKLRLLLAGACRYAFRVWLRMEREVADALELLERFADTGQSKKELRDFRKAYWGPWRGMRTVAYKALHESLNPNDPLEAVTEVTHAIRQAHKLSDREALRDLRRLYRDLLPPADAAKAFAPAWRTPAVVALAESMYSKRDFQEMPRLAELLAETGCDQVTLLEHCRDPNALHIRGCWVIDAILDGSWAKAPAPVPSKRKTLLSTLSKPAQYAVRQVIEEQGGEGTLIECLARRWDFEGFARSQRMNDQRIAEWAARATRLYPKWTAEQVKIAISFQSLAAHWSTELAVARRIVAEDPAELGRGECIARRLGWLDSRLSDAACPGSGGATEPWALVDTMAVRDAALAKRQAERIARLADPSQEEDQDRAAKAVLAAYHRNWAALESQVKTMGRRKPYPYQKWAYTGLTGIAGRDPALVAEGLNQRLEYEKHLPLADRATVATAAHGFYWFCHSIAPELVAAFDVARPLPWDAEFHAWMAAHEDPLAGLDLNGISPILHKALVSLELPDWWAAAADDGLPGDPCQVVLTSLGPKPKWTVKVVMGMAGVSEAEAQDLTQSLPAVISEPMPRIRAWAQVDMLQQNGASAELRRLY